MAWDGAIAGYNRVRQQDDASSLAELQRAGAVQGIVKSALEQEAAARTRAREGEFRTKLAALGENPTHEQVRSLALQSGLVAPKDMLSNDLGMYRADAMRDMRVQNLLLQKQKADQQYEIGMRNAKTKEDQAAVSAWRAKVYAVVNQRAQELNVPMDIVEKNPFPDFPQFNAPQAEQPAQQSPFPAPRLPTQKPATGWDADIPVDARSVPPAVQAARNADAAQIVAREAQPNGGGALPTNSVIAAPSPAVASPSPSPVQVPPAIMQPKPVSEMPGAPKPPTLADAPPGLSRKDAQKWLLGQSKETASLSPQDREKSVQYWSEVMIAGGTLPPGLARNREGVQLVKDIMAKVATGGTAPKDMLSNQAEFQGQKAGQRTLSTRIANIEMAASEAANLMPIAIAASEKVDRTQYPSLNSILLAAEKKTGDTNVVQLAVATNSLINAYARAISPSGTPTVSDKDHAREILASAYSKGQYASAVKMMQREIDAARKSPHQVRESMKEEFTRNTTGKGGSDTWKDL